MTRTDLGADLTVNVATLLGEPAGSIRDYAFDDLRLDLGPDIELARPADARFRLTRTNRGLLVDGDVRATLAEICGRCLRPIEVELAETFEEEALPSVELAGGPAPDPTAEPDIARLTDHHEIELEPFLREAILLGAPIAPLCRPDCPGLCPVCGIELGSGPHDHADEPVDPRFAALRGFRVDGDDETA